MKHLYTDGVDTLIAESIEDADKQFLYITENEHGDNPGPWEMIPDENYLTIHFDETPKAEYLPADYFSFDEFDGVAIRARAKDWAACDVWLDVILCSTEY